MRTTGRAANCSIACDLLASPGASRSGARQSQAPSTNSGRSSGSPSSPSPSIEANVWGNTIEAAATAAVRATAPRRTTELAALTALLDRAMLAELPDASAHCWRAFRRGRRSPPTCAT